VKADLDGVTDDELAGIRRRLARRTRVDPVSGCWLWIGSIGTEGYGQFHIRGRLNGWLDKAHRASYRAHNGPLNGLCVLHHCDNRPCINPDHLFLGTRTDNNADKLTKGREARLAGVRNGRAKLSEQQAIEAASRSGKGESLMRIAKDYGVTRGAIAHIVTGKNWKHISRTST
jgi:hypothetical protein